MRFGKVRYLNRDTICLIAEIIIRQIPKSTAFNLLRIKVCRLPYNEIYTPQLPAQNNIWPSRTSSSAVFQLSSQGNFGNKTIKVENFRYTSKLINKSITSTTTKFSEKDETIPAQQHLSHLSEVQNLS